MQSTTEDLRTASFRTVFIIERALIILASAILVDLLADVNEYFQ
jgi:hypothetical protein